MSRADALEVCHCNFSRIYAALTEDYVARLEPELCGLDFAGVAPSAYAEAVWIKMLQPNIALNVRIGGHNSVVDLIRQLIKAIGGPF